MEVAPHEGVRDGHDLAEDIVRALGDTYVVVERLAHLLHAVEAFKNGQGDAGLRSLPHDRLQMAADEEIELLIGSSELDIRLQRHRVVPLKERVEKLVNGDGTVGLVALGEVVALSVVC